MNGTTVSLCQLKLRPLSNRFFRKLSTRRTSFADPAWNYPLHPGSFFQDTNPEFTSASSEVCAERLGNGEGAVSEFRRKRLQRQREVKREQEMYRFIAFAASSFLAALAAAATYFRFVFMKPPKAPFPWLDFAATLLLVCFGTMGMEMYARIAHRVWWHESSAGWALHKSHHEPRTGPFEANDIYAVANALPAFTLCFFGMFHQGIIGCLAFGLGLGITLFGMAYMFVHDGLVHRRFPVGPLADLPLMKKIAAAHKIHHMDKYGGLPYGLFLGPQEIAHLPEAVAEMERIAATLGNKN